MSDYSVKIDQLREIVGKISNKSRYTSDECVRLGRERCNLEIIAEIPNSSDYRSKIYYEFDFTSKIFARKNTNLD